MSVSLIFTDPSVCQVCKPSPPQLISVSRGFRDFHDLFSEGLAKHRVRIPFCREALLITGRNEVVAKVMFLHVSVILSTGRTPPGGWENSPSRESPPYWARQGTLILSPPLSLLGEPWPPLRPLTLQTPPQLGLVFWTWHCTCLLTLTLCLFTELDIVRASSNRNGQKNRKIGIHAPKK